MPLRAVLPLLFLVTAPVSTPVLYVDLKRATPVIYVDLKRPPGNFLQGLVPHANQCLLAEDLRGRVTQARVFRRWQELLMKSHAISLMVGAGKYQYLG